MVVNSILRAGKFCGKTSLSAAGSAIQDILKLDDKVLDNLILAQQKAKKGIYRSIPWNCTPREMQEIGTKLAYKDMLTSKINALSAKYPREIKVLNMDGAEKEFVIFKGSQSGSNEGYWALAKGTDDLYYIKYGGEAQIRSEQLAGELYELGGIPSTKKIIVSYKIPAKNKFSLDTRRVGIASKWMPINCLPEANDAKIVREGFGLDCWLANWDALKEGNVVMSAGEAARLDVGGSLCYRARGGRKGAAFGENVNEFTSFFEGYSHSLPYIKNMTRDELIQSVERVTSIPDDKIIETIDRAARYKTTSGGINYVTGEFDWGMTTTRITGVKNPEYLKEVLIARKDYMEDFRKQCLNLPQNEGETIGQYIRRVDNTLAKTKYDVPFEKIEMSKEVTDGISGISMAERLTPSQKKLYEDSYHAFKTSSKNKIILQDSGPVLTDNMMLHATSYKNLDEILTRGITSGDFRGRIGTGTGCSTQTPLCADFWDIQGQYKIKDYFSRCKYNPGEANFLPRTTPGGLSNTRNAMVFVVNKKAVSPTIMKNSFKVSEQSSILYKDGNMAGHINYNTHRAVPIGVPANAVEKILIRKEYYSQEVIQQIKDIIAQKGLNIKLYDLDGNLL